MKLNNTLSPNQFRITTSDKNDYKLLRDTGHARTSSNQRASEQFQPANTFYSNTPSKTNLDTLLLPKKFFPISVSNSATSLVPEKLGSLKKPAKFLGSQTQSLFRASGDDAYRSVEVPGLYDGHFSKRDTNIEELNLNFSKTQNMGMVTGNNFNEPSEVDLKDIEKKVDTLKEELNSLNGIVFPDDELVKAIKMINSYSHITLEKSYSRFILLPETDNGLTKVLIQLESTVVKMIKTFKKVYEKMHGKLDEVNKKFHTSAEEMKNFRLRTSETVRGFINNTHNYETKEIKDQLNIAKKQSETSDMLFQIEKQRLQVQIDTLTKKLNYYETEHPYAQLKKDYDALLTANDNKFKSLEQTIDKKNNRIYKIELELAAEKSTSQQVQKEFDELKLKYDDLFEKSEYSLNKYKENEEQVRKYREIAFMTREDMYGKEMQHQKTVELFHKIKDKYYETQSRLDEIMREQGNNSAFSEAYFEKDKQLFSLIKEVFHNNKRPILYTNYLKDKENAAEGKPQNFDNMNLLKYSYMRPTFYAFIKTEFEEALKQGSNLKSQAANAERDFVSMVRGIFDSKYNEYFYQTHMSQVSQFADFVFGWLSIYTIDPKERKVRQIIADDKIDIDFRRLQVYHQLLNPKLMKVWDVVTFREFLEEKYSPDEIFFYLYCRNLLFDGCQLDFLTASINIVHLVKMDKVERFFDIVLRKMDRDQLAKIKYHLKEKAKTKNRMELIDAGFVLRVLLEIYRHERKIKFVNLTDTFYKINGGAIKKKVDLSYEQFRQFMEMNYPNISFSETARIFRESWALGNGALDHEAFFTYASESGFFITSLMSQYFGDITGYIQYNSQYKAIREISEQSQQMFSSMNNFLKTSKYVLGNVGIESAHSEFEEVEKFFSKVFVEKRPTGDHSILKLTSLFNIITRAKLQYVLMHRVRYEGEKLALQEDMLQTEKSTSTIIHLVNVQASVQMDVQRKVKKFQNSMRFRMNKWYSLMGVLRKKIKEEKDKLMNEKKEMASTLELMKKSGMDKKEDVKKMTKKSTKK